MKEEYVTYVLYSVKHDRIYIGMTSNLLQRFLSHNELSKKGFTSRYRPWLVISVEFFDIKVKALKREKSLKAGQGRREIREVIMKNPIISYFISK